jgi:hypothetical protein
MAVRPIGALAAVILCLALSAWNCASRDPLTHEFPAHFKIWCTGDTLGMIFPCGCHVPTGGLSRRGGVLDQDLANYPDRVIVDAGSWLGGSSNYNRFVAKWNLKALTAMGYSAVNLGTYETQVTVEALRALDADSGGMLVSANVMDRSVPPLPATRQYLIRDVGSIRIGITGVTRTGTQPADAIDLPQVVLPVPELQKVMQKFQEERVDYVILLADTIRDEVAAIVNEVPDIDFVVQSEGFSVSAPYQIQRVEDSRIINIGDQGKYLAWARLDFQPDGTVASEEAGTVSLGPTSPTLAAITDLLIQFKTELKTKRAEFLGDPGNPFQLGGSADYVDILSGFAGPSFCQTCHVGYALDQQLVGHDRAWLILDEANKTNPACLPCHVTGYNLPTGVMDVYRDSHLNGVTCEACHGPAAIHVRDEMAAQKGLDLSTLLSVDNPTGLEFSKEVPEEVCLRCHTEEWSPDFDYQTWLPRVNHASMKNRPQMTNPETGDTIVPPVGDSSQGSTGR